jgi:hypothetical protein
MFWQNLIVRAKARPDRRRHRQGVHPAVIPSPPGRIPIVPAATADRLTQTGHPKHGR